jgi:chromosome segregation protein
MAAAETAIRARVERIEARVVGEKGDGDEIAEEMRACSQREYELQAEMKVASDRLTETEVEAAHLGDRRAEAARELATISEQLGEEIEPAEKPLDEGERNEIDRRLEVLEVRDASHDDANQWAGIG